MTVDWAQVALDYMRVTQAWAETPYSELVESMNDRQTFAYRRAMALFWDEKRGDLGLSVVDRLFEACTGREAGNFFAHLPDDRIPSRDDALAAYVAAVGEVLQEKKVTS